MLYTKSYPNELVLQVRKKWYIVPWANPNLLRKDDCGARIRFDKYGDRNSENWWEIDHIMPVSRWGSDLLSNLRPLQRQNNLSKSDWRLTCPVTAR